MKHLEDTNHHVTQTALNDFATGSLQPEELDDVASHIAGCEQCAIALAEVLEAGEPAEVPEGFEEEISNRIYRLRQKNAEFFHFSLRVALAACITLFFVFSSVLNVFNGSRNHLINIKAPGFSVVESVSTNLRNFSQQILEMEVFKND